MTYKFLLFTFLTIASESLIFGQKDTYTISLAPFSSDRYDEFSPVFYINGIVFCTNRKSSSLINYSSPKGKGPVNIYYIDTTRKVKWQRSELYSEKLWSKMNNGPVTFNRTLDTLYFSRNQRIEGRLKDLNGSNNKLGVFSATFTADKFEKIQEFRYNSEWFNITAPSLSPDGLKLFFASDRPDGYGGLDIYYSQWKKGYWNDPVNLGPPVNTRGNESYPFINEAGELFFSSDGHQGFGGKDLFVTKQVESGWYPPVRLDEPVNSKFDDFGIVHDPLTDQGYFSSNRGKTVDIYHFNSNSFQFWFSEPQKENQFCLSVSDSGSIIIDTLSLQYVWEFDDGSKMYGPNVRHCFPGPGKYKINLDIIDRRTGKLFFRKLTYDIEIFEIDQPFITSPDVAIAGETIELDGLKSFCPGYDITGYFWDYGDSVKGIGDRVNHKYSESGVFDIRMGLTLKSQTTGEIIKRVVSKKIMVLQAGQERASFQSATPVLINDLNDIRKIENIKVNGHYTAETDFNKESQFRVVILSSPVRIAPGSAYFRNMPAKYTVNELFDSETGNYSYIVDRQMSLMAAFPAFSEMISSGYPDAIVRLFVLKEPAEKELYNIVKNYGVLTDDYFDTGSRMLTSAYIMLDQVAILMNKYPEIKLEITVHTDNQGVMSNITWLSLSRARLMVNYLITRGISDKRLTAKGYGGARPVGPNISPDNRRLNRRVEFTIVKE